MSGAKHPSSLILAHDRTKSVRPFWDRTRATRPGIPILFPDSGREGLRGGDRARQADPAFRATLRDGGAVDARRVLLAGGMRCQVPDTPGLAALWGDRAFACPYCHGWEHRDQRIGILGVTATAHRAALLRSWSEDLLVLADGRLAPEDG